MQVKLIRHSHGDGTYWYSVSLVNGEDIETVGEISVFGYLFKFSDNNYCCILERISNVNPI